MGALELAAMPVSPVMSETAGALAAINEASVEVKKHGEATRINVYTTSALSTTITQPLKTNARGEIPGFIEETGEQVDLVVTQSGFNSVTHTITAGGIAVGGWTAVTLNSSKIEEAAGVQTVRVRMRAGRSEAVLRGEIAVKSGESIATGELILTVPEKDAALNNLRPLGACRFATVTSAQTARVLELKTNGELVLSSGSTIASTNAVPLDGLSWNIT